MTVLAPDDADLAVLGVFGRKLEDAPEDPRAAWRRTARPEQLLPPGNDWRVCYWQGGRGAGKNASCSNAMADWVLSDTDGEGEYGIIAPTYADAWTKCVEGKTGILRALGTSMAEIKDHRSRTVRGAWRTYGQVVLHNGITIYVDSAAEGGLRVQGRNLKGAWCVAAGEKVATARGPVPVERVCVGDMVATRQGWRRVTARALTRRNADVVKLTAEDGQTVRLTADHRVWTANRGWRMASSLTPYDTIALWNPTLTNSNPGHPLTSCGTATSGITTIAPATTATPPRVAFTLPSGSTSTSSGARTAATSTTRTTTRRTTTRRTLSSRRTASTWPTTTTRTPAGSPDGTPKGTASRRRHRGRARLASSPARSAAAGATAPGRLPSTARTSAARPPSSPAATTLPGSTRTPPPTRRIPPGATQRPASGSAPSAGPRTAPWPPAPSTARRNAAPRRWPRGAGRSPASTAAPCSRRLPRVVPNGARSAGRGTTAQPSARRGSRSSRRNAPASTAARSTQPGSRTTPSTAPRDAATRPGWQPGSLTRCPEPDGTADVYDLTVEGAHEFFAGGILVHNCSEIGLWDKWETAWKESVVYAVRDGRSQIIVDGTPKASRKARKLIRSFIRNDPEHGGVIIRKLRTRDNIANLSEAFVRAVVGGFRGTRLEQQELEGELLDDVANALWTRDLLDSVKCPAVGQPGGPPYLLKTYIGVDPSDGSEDSDEQAYTVIGKGNPEDKHLYVAENWGGQESPVLFAKRVIRKAVEWNATVVVERNHGGKWLTAVFAQAQKDMHTSVRVETVHASDAKRARAEPVAVMYDRFSEDGRPLVLHCHRTWKDDEGHLQVDEHMPELEDCMATFTGGAGEKSPDRLDSLVWAASKFLRESFGPPGAAGIRQWAGHQEFENMGVNEETKATRRMREIAGRAAENLDDAPWDLDGFSPQDEREARPNRGNVRSWR